MRVAVRIRPLRESDQADGAQEILRKVAGEPQVVLGADRAFTFDHVFDTAAAQHEVYEGCAQALVERVLKGYNSTVLAYGQTGSGKTHTMGSIGTPSSAVPEAALGIIPRTVAEIFARVAGGDGELEGAALAASASFIEVYKEDIHDLLQPPIEAAAADGAPKLATLEVREKEGAIALPGLAMRPVGSPEEAMAVLSDGSSNRATGATAMNATSSRSHAIFTVSIELRLRGGKVLTPRFNFVDLAGSERAKRTGASGDRFAEGVQINKVRPPSAPGPSYHMLSPHRACVPGRDTGWAHTTTGEARITGWPRTTALTVVTLLCRGCSPSATSSPRCARSTRTCPTATRS